MEISEKKIQDILDDWNFGHPHYLVRFKNEISPEVEFAITRCSEGLEIKEIAARIKCLKPGMKSKEIRNIMQG